MARQGDRAVYKGERWVVTEPGPFLGDRQWRLRRRDASTITGWVGALARESALTDVVTPTFTVGEPVTVGAPRFRGTVVAIEGTDGRPIYVVMIPEEVRTSPGGTRYLRDAQPTRVGAELLNI